MSNRVDFRRPLWQSRDGCSVVAIPLSVSGTMSATHDASSPQTPTYPGIHETLRRCRMKHGPVERTARDRDPDRARKICQC
jgi:hypothetical protein